MSAFITTNTPMIDQECLLMALSDLGFDTLEVHQEPMPLMGYQNDIRIQKANIIIRKQFVGTASNDIGFLETVFGYKIFISEYDKKTYGNSWMEHLVQSYQKHWAAKQEKLKAEERKRIEEARLRLVESQRQEIQDRAKKMGYQVKESREGDSIRMVLVKRTY